MAWKLSLEEINEYKAAFHLFDENQDGRIESEELGLLMRSLGQNFSNAELKEITKEITNNKLSGVEFHEFLDIMAKNRRQKDDYYNLIKAFKYFDKNNTGFIYLNEFKHIITTIAEKLNQEEIDKLEEIAKVDGNGKFNYRDLVRAIISK